MSTEPGDPDEIAAIIIDPPVTPWSSPAELRAWLRELEALRAQKVTPDVLETIRWHEEIAHEWLDAQLRERS